jgi:KDO2-lipid IV(A) lauroyltransferase
VPVSHGVLRSLAVAVAWVVGRLPFRALPRLGAVLAWIAFDLLRIRRAHVIAALRRAELGDETTARAVYRSLGAGLGELLWIAGRPREDLRDLVEIEGWPIFEAAKARGRGVIVATAHTGNWDLAALSCAARTPLAVVTKRLSARGLDAFWQSSRARRGLSLLAAADLDSAEVGFAGGVWSTVRGALARGQSVALLVDQDPERTTGVVAEPFLGEIALHDTFPAAIAARTGASIVVALARRERGRHVVEIVARFDPPARAGRAWIEATTRAIAHEVEAFVRRDPSGWLWLHRRWKTRPAAR